MRKCKFQKTLLEDEQFRTWLQPVEGQNGEGFCNVCKRVFKLGAMGINAVKSHMKSEGYKSALKGRQQLTTSSYFSVTTTTSTTTAPAVVTTTSSGAAMVGKSSDLRAAFGSNATLKAEVLWCLNTAIQHYSYASNEGVSDLFPVSEIVKSFNCGKDKTSYILKFGQKDADQLAEHAENKSNTLVAQMITQSNTLRRRCKEKCDELKNVECESNESK